MEDFQAFVVELVTAPCFWIGGIVVPTVVFGTLWLVGQIVAAWNAILRFFRPTATPGRIPAGQGPSPFQYLLSCLISLVLLAVVVVGIVMVISWVVG